MSCTCVLTGVIIQNFHIFLKDLELVLQKISTDIEKLITAQINLVQQDSSSISQVVPAETRKAYDPNRHCFLVLQDFPLIRQTSRYRFRCVISTTKNLLRT